MQAHRTKTTTLARTFLTICTLILGASLAFAGSQKISKDLERRAGSAQIDVIVQFNQLPTSAYHEKVLSRGGTVKRVYSEFRGAAYTISSSALEDLAADPD